MVRVYQTNPEIIAQLQNQFDVWGADSDDRYAVLGIPGRTQLEQLLALGYQVVVDPQATERYRTPLPQSLGTGTVPGFPCYRTVEATFATAEQIVAQHPSLAQLVDIGDSWEKTQNNASGYDLWVLKLTNQNIAGEKPKLFVMSAIHAREMATAELMTRFAERLIDGYGVEADPTWLLDHHEVHLLLQSNPDGRKRAETGLLWRKNTNNNYCSGTNTRGADLNRNFPWEWGGAAGTAACDTTYQGPTPGSEPEVQALVNYWQSIYPDQRGPGLNDAAPLNSTGVVIDVHSFSQLVLWPYGFSSSVGPSPNAAQFSTFGRRLAYFNGYRPQQIIGLTAASGSSADQAYGELGVAGLAFEIGTEFFQQCDFFEANILEQNIQALMYAAKVARTPYLTPSGPDVTQFELLGNTAFVGDAVPVRLTGDGRRFSTVMDSTSPLESPRPVSGIALYLDQLPWQDSASAMALADDGSFNSPLEAGSATLETQGLAAGRHTVYATAIGTDSQAGAIQSRFLHVLDPLSAGQLAGVVRFAGGTAPVAQARIQAGSFTSISDQQGQFSLPLPAGSYMVTASAQGATGMAESVTITAGQTLNLDLNVPARCDLFSDDVEEGNQGWTTTGNWAIVTEQSNSPTHAWHDSPGGNYSNNQNVTLTSASMDLSDASQSQLSFYHLCDTEAGFDFGIVEVSANGGPWQEVYRCDNQIAWQEQSVGVTNLDGVANARFRFRLNTDTSQTDNGWFIDDVRLNAVSPQCIAEDPDLILSDSFES